MTRAKLELLHDPTQYKMIQGSIRGGLAFVANRYEEASDDQVICNFDANNMYGFAMSYPMPLNNFKWLSQEEVANFNIMDIDPFVNEGQGYILEVCSSFTKSTFTCILFTGGSGVSC